MPVKKVIQANKKINEWASKSKIEFDKVRDQFGEQGTVKKIDEMLCFFEENSQYLIDFFNECEKKGKSILQYGQFPPKYKLVDAKTGNVIKQ